MYIYIHVCMYIYMHVQDSVQQHNRNYDIRSRHQHNWIIVMIIIVREKRHDSVGT